MSTKFFSAAITATALLIGSPLAIAQANSLDQLLQQTRELRNREAQANQEREARFLAERNQQQQLMREAEAELRRQQQRSEQLSSEFDANETRLTEMQAELDAKAEFLGQEMFGVVRQVAGDFLAVSQNSMITAQYPDREDFAAKLSESRALPSIAELERLWFEMQREMTETGDTEFFDATLVSLDGTETQARILRVGPFTAIGPDGEFLRHTTGEHSFQELGRQPSAAFTAVADDTYDGGEGYIEAVVDPTRGSLLAILMQRPSFGDQVAAGGIVGYFILGLAAIGILIALERLVGLSVLGGKIKRQRRDVTNPRGDNPLGRVLGVYYKDPKVDLETLELRLDEAIMREVPNIEKRLPAIKVLAAVGPLLGLFGTVIGMIATFQAITLFGTGDPKLMAGGISQALVTTVLGLVMAIPLVLFHAFLASRAKSLVQILEEESAGIIAEQAEKTHHA